MSGREAQLVDELMLMRMRTVRLGFCCGHEHEQERVGYQPRLRTARRTLHERGFAIWTEPTDCEREGVGRDSRGVGGRSRRMSKNERWVERVEENGEGQAALSKAQSKARRPVLQITARAGRKTRES